MRIRLIVFAFFLSASFVSATTLEDIAKLSRVKASDELIFQVLANDPLEGEVTSRDVIYLKEQGVSERIIRHLLTVSKPSRIGRQTQYDNGIRTYHRVKENGKKILVVTNLDEKGQRMGPPPPEQPETSPTYSTQPEYRYPREIRIIVETDEPERYQRVDYPDYYPYVYYPTYVSGIAAFPVHSFGFHPGFGFSHHRFRFHHGRGFKHHPFKFHHRFRFPHHSFRFHRGFRHPFKFHHRFRSPHHSFRFHRGFRHHSFKSHRGFRSPHHSFRSHRGFKQHSFRSHGRSGFHRGMPSGRPVIRRR